MAQATPAYTRFHNLSDEALADALGHADAAQAPDPTNLSGSRALDVISESTASIPAIDTPTIRRSDNGSEVINPSPIAPPARPSRRGFLMNSIVSGAALASAIATATAVEALPAAEAIRETSADPIFAAIERCKEAAAVEEAAFRARSAAQHAFRDRHGSLTPSGMPREMAEIFEKAGEENPYWSLRTHKQITELKNHAELGKLVPFCHRQLNTQTDDYEENVAPFEETADSANNSVYDVIQRFFETVPTTLAGLRAKIDFVTNTQHVTEFLDSSDEDDLRNFLNTLYASAGLIAHGDTSTAGRTAQ
jgi:hypothetical protein